MNKDFKNNNSIFNREATEKLDKQINEHLSRPTLIGQMKKTSKIASHRVLDWTNEFKRYWYVYIFLTVSAIFTMTLGFYMGVSPVLDSVAMTLTYQTDILHLFLALVYAVSFVCVTEVAFVIGKWLFFTREENNPTQKISMIVMMVIAGISILGTGIAGGRVIASNISFLTDYVEVSKSAQTWVIIAIPALVTIYTFLVSFYSLSSDSAASERLLNEQKRNATLDFEARQRAIDQITAESLQAAEIERFIQLVGAGRISAVDARAAIKAGRTLGQEETRQDRDIDGQDGIGNGERHPVASQSYPPVSTASKPAPMTTDISFGEFMQFQKMYQGRQNFSVVELGEVFSRIDGGADGCYRSFRNSNGLPQGMTRANFEKIYSQVMLAMPVPDPAGISNNGSKPNP